MAVHSLVKWLLVTMAACSSSLVHATVKLTHLSTIYLPYNFTGNVPLYNLSSDAVEQVTYDPKEKIIYGAGYGVIHVIDSADASKLTYLYSRFANGIDFTDIEMCGDYVFASAESANNKLQGQLRVYKKHKRNGQGNLDLINTITVGASPDMIYPRPDCRAIYVALEGEAFTAPDNKFVDPEGGFAIVSWPNTPDNQAVVKTLNFQNFNNRVDELLPTGLRYVYRENNTLSADLEPEFIAFDPDTKKAYVCLQENNGIAEVDLVSETVSRISGLGYKQWGVLDASDRDNVIQLSYWPIRAWYMPDSIQFARWKGRRLLFSANEGGKKKYDHFRESQRGKYFTALGDGIPAVVKSYLRDDRQLGRLKFSKLDGLDKNRTHQALYTYGGRSFSIWDADNFSRIYDSDSDVEKITALRCPHAFNTEGEEVDEKSDSKGPETETLALGQIGERLYVFVGNENPGTIFVYSLGEDVTQPRFETIFCDGFPDNARTLQEKFDAREVYALDPEELKFVSAKDSPTGSPVLITSGSISGTVSILRIDVTDGPGDPVIPKRK